MLRRLAAAPAPRLQARLAVGAVDDPLEREADAAADRVMRMVDPALAPACAAVEETASLRARPAGAQLGKAGGEAPASVREALGAPGQPLDAQTRAFFEPRFGRDFSGVRVHRDAAAARSAEAVGALAYTVRNDLVFASGTFAPHTEAGRRLIAHELAHVIQQDAGGEAGVRRETPPPAAPAPAAPDAGAAPPPAAAAPAPGVPCPPTTKVVATTLAEYVDLMRCAEATTKWSPREMLTLFRELYYGSQAWSVSSNPVWDDVITCPFPVGNPPVDLGKPLFDSLQASQEVAGVDVGHVFVGLESMMCPSASVTASQTVLGVHPSVSTPNEAFATWAGDLGAAVSARTACPDMGAAAATNDDCFHLSGSRPLSDYLKESAPDQDLQGDIDAYVLRARGLGIACGVSALKKASLPAGKLSDIFQAYYNNPASTLGAAHVNNARCFIESLGGQLDPTGKFITNRPALLDPMRDKVVEFAQAFYYKTTKSKSGAFGAYMANLAGAGPMYTDSRAAASWFLTWLEARL
jgi:hypothetical protein